MGRLILKSIKTSYSKYFRIPNRKNLPTENAALCIKSASSQGFLSTQSTVPEDFGYILI